MHHSDFWKRTPYEISIVFDAYATKQTERRQELLSLAWYIEAFSRQKRLPKLEKILRQTNKKQKQKKQITKTELIQIAKSKGLKVPTQWRC